MTDINMKIYCVQLGEKAKKKVTYPSSWLLS